MRVNESAAASTKVVRAAAIISWVLHRVVTSDAYGDFATILQLSKKQKTNHLRK